ncbi:MAG: hypothetical protein DCF31_17435 [Alphaproteobacteria bacterium]|nr:MAG: hypothetical protein DCF31_17435 [Alphaproteobacteria bacterium]
MSATPRIQRLLEGWGRRLPVTARSAVLFALLVLLASLGLAVRNEQLAKQAKLEQAHVQVRILAGSVAAPLAFEDNQAARDYVDALRADPMIAAAGAYRLDGTLAAGFTRGRAVLPRPNRLAAPVILDNSVIITAPVVEAGTQLGSVYLRMTVETWDRRALRYLGIGLVVLMVSLLTVVLGTSYASIAEANARLEHEIETRQKAEEALVQSQKMEAMGQLTGGVAHDFNNLLTPIMASLDMLQRRGIGTEREQRMIGAAAQSAERARVLVQRLLAFARRQPLQARAIELGDLVAGLGDLLASTCGPQIRVVVDVPATLPPVVADPHQLEMAILNLGVNARDAMEAGGSLRVTAAVTGPAGDDMAPGHYVRLDVADTGSGMDAATRARAIEPFFSTKGIGKGTGLGLSMVHGLMLQSGGAMRIDSAPGRGTVISLYMPVSDETPAEVAKPGEIAPAAANAGTALVVDDEELVRASIADMLQELGYRTVEATSAAAALEIIAAQPAFDVVVTDHLMPGISGAELALRLRDSHPQLPVVIVSGYAETEGLPTSVPRLTKPFRRDDMAALLADLA